MLKKLRVIIAAIVFVLITLLFLDFTGTLHKWFGWLADVQFIPALLAVNLAVVLVLIVATLLFGRIYCSVVCPLGIMQDCISNLSGRRKGKKNRFRYSKAITWLRWVVFVVFVVCLLAGIGAVVSLLDPYAAYGRIASNLLGPLYGWGNNFFARIAERIDSYSFYSTEVFVKSWIVFGVAVATLVIVAVLAWRGGRTWCNTVCPVGTVLGLFSRFSLFRPTFDDAKCTNCGLCEKGCKASCIDSANRRVDMSRCVTCFNCMEKCNFGAIGYRPTGFGSGKQGAGSGIAAGRSASAPVSGRKSASVSERTAGSSADGHVSSPTAEKSSKGVSRRSFLSIAALFAAANTVKAQQLQVDGGLADIEAKKRPERKTHVTPPGSTGAAHLKQHCTACQLCVSACPNHILVPSSRLDRLMQPEMTFEKGFCRPECTECAQVCPSGAIANITSAEKSAISVGQAFWIKENCVVNTENLTCTACQRHCPTEAIVLVALDPEDRRSLKIPVVDNTKCIGCGACEYHCPARPFSAIYVEGNVVHHKI